MEITDQGKGVVVNYLQSAAEATIIGKARAAIYRYTDLEIPTLDEIRQRYRNHTLSILDRLVIAMEYEAKRLPPDAKL